MIIMDFIDLIVRILSPVCRIALVVAIIALVLDARRKRGGRQ